jgi:hypothetical protein
MYQHKFNSILTTYLDKATNTGTKSKCERYKQRGGRNNNSPGILGAQSRALDYRFMELTGVFFHTYQIARFAVLSSSKRSRKRYL